MEKHGGICDCQSSRDTFIYASSSDRRGLETATHVLAETVLRPKFDDTEVDFARQIVQFELETLNMRPEQEPILMDRIHAAAYRGNTLGLPKLCPLENADKINRDVLLSFLRLHHIPTRMVLAGVGVDHDELVKYAEKYFTMPATWELETLKNTSVNTVDNSIAQYTGGEVKVSFRTTSLLHVNWKIHFNSSKKKILKNPKIQIHKQEECDIPVYAASDLPELAHVVIGLEGTSHEDPDFVASCVLNLIMGGGGSFSAGGPGKGMYTRLYTNVLNQHHWMYSATASNHAYKDTGLFCIHVSAPPKRVSQAVKVIMHEMIAMASVPGSEELRRAKTQLQSMLLMNLEARPVVFEDIGRQVLASGRRKKPEEFIEAIGKRFILGIQHSKFD